VEDLFKPGASAIDARHFFILLLIAVNSKDKRLLDLLLAQKSYIKSVINIDSALWKRAESLQAALALPKQDIGGIAD
jgi:hypothetical protein